MTQTGLQS